MAKLERGEASLAQNSRIGVRSITRPLLIWAGGATVVAAFAYLDARVGCAFFQRGGAALVIYAIFVSVASLRARAVYGDELNAIQLEQCAVAQLMYDVEHEPRSDARIRLERTIRPRLEALDGRLSRLAESSRRFQDLRLAEGPLLIIGTLVWGFGDLVLRAPGCTL